MDEWELHPLFRTAPDAADFRRTALRSDEVNIGWRGNEREVCLHTVGREIGEQEPREIMRRLTDERGETPSFIEQPGGPGRYPMSMDAKNTWQEFVVDDNC